MKAPVNISTGREYQGGNVANLLMRGFTSPEFGTFLQWKKAGFAVKKGQKGTPIKVIVERAKKDDDDKNTRSVRGYFVFNKDQVEEIKEDK